MHTHIYRFGKFELLPDAEELHRNGALVHLPPQPLRILLLLVARAGEIVTRDEIRAAVWGSETFVDYRQGVNTAIRQIRAALGDNARVSRYLQTIPRRGYRFIAPVDRIVPEEFKASLEAMLPATPAHRDNPILLVLLAIGVLATMLFRRGSG